MGGLRWFYAPIREVGDKFLDEFTEEVFLHFKAWEATLWSSFNASVVVMILAHWLLGVPLRFKKRCG